MPPNEPGAPRTPEHYVHGAPGARVVLVPARIAARLSDLAGLSQLRIRVRGTDTELTNVLTALHLASIDWRSAATGTDSPPTPELAPHSQWMSTTEAGNLIGISDRAVRKAIAQNRLTATTAGHGYRISREAAEHYRITRKRAA